MTFVERTRNSRFFTESRELTVRMIQIKSGCAIAQLTKNQNATPAKEALLKETKVREVATEEKEAKRFPRATRKIRGGVNLRIRMESQSV